MLNTEYFPGSELATPISVFSTTLYFYYQYKIVIKSSASYIQRSTGRSHTVDYNQRSSIIFSSSFAFLVSLNVLSRTLNYPRTNYLYTHTNSIRAFLYGIYRLPKHFLFDHLYTLRRATQDSDFCIASHIFLRFLPRNVHTFITHMVSVTLTHLTSIRSYLWSRLRINLFLSDSQSFHFSCTDDAAELLRIKSYAWHTISHPTVIIKTTINRLLWHKRLQELRATLLDTWMTTAKHPRHDVSLSVARS